MQGLTPEKAAALLRSIKDTAKIIIQREQTDDEPPVEPAKKVVAYYRVLWMKLSCLPAGLKLTQSLTRWHAV